MSAPAFTLHVGHCLDVLRSLPADIVHCCVTSPPYWGLRDYKHKDQLGQERTPEEYVARMVEVFREVRRVLRPDGTLWLNLGDSYAGSGRGAGDVHTKNRGNPNSRTGSRTPCGYHETARQGGAIGRAWVSAHAGYKQKDLVGIPWLVAFALRADGWWLRQDIVWNKPNPMPESVTDRCTKAHEYLFLLTKSARYYFDAEAIAEPAVYGGDQERYDRAARAAEAHKSMPDELHNGIRPRSSWKGSQFHTGKTGDHQLGRASKKRGEFAGKTNALPGREAFRAITETRNKRSVWTVPSQPYRGAHFATFPPELIRPCILAGCPRGGVVLDPFGGSGTTGAVALETGRAALLIELNPDYAALIRARCEASRPHWVEPIAQQPPAADMPLFAASA